LIINPVFQTANYTKIIQYGQSGIWFNFLNPFARAAVQPTAKRLAGRLWTTIHRQPAAQLLRARQSLHTIPNNRGNHCQMESLCRCKLPISQVYQSHSGSCSLVLRATVVLPS